MSSHLSGEQHGATQLEASDRPDASFAPPGGAAGRTFDVGAVAGPRRNLLARWSWLLILVGGVAACLVVLHVLVITSNVNFFPALLLIGSITVPVTVLVLAEELGDASGREAEQLARPAAWSTSRYRSAAEARSRTADRAVPVATSWPTVPVQGPDPSFSRPVS